MTVDNLHVVNLEPNTKSPKYSDALPGKALSATFTDKEKGVQGAQ